MASSTPTGRRADERAPRVDGRGGSGQRLRVDGAATRDGGIHLRRWAAVGAPLAGALAAVAYLSRGGGAAGYRSSPAWRAYNGAATAIDHAVGWDRLPKPLGLAVLIGVRNVLRQRNLYDTESEPASARAPVPPPPADYLTTRTADGTYNDLDDPQMGRAGARFGRNIALHLTHPEPPERVLTPNPRLVSRRLLTRETFQPATTVNGLAASWLQFMIRDWFSHGHGPSDDPWVLPPVEEDGRREASITIPRTRPDPTAPLQRTSSPPTYQNTETHWWDGSQLYGSRLEIQRLVRSGEDGKLIVGDDGIIPLPDDPERNPAMVPGWWLGLAVMRNLFTLEHNAICDRLRREYPSWSDEQLFQRARLVNAALLAKIHTVEWTPAIISHPTTVTGLRANWYGLATQRVYDVFGRISGSEVISGIPGSKTNHYGVPYSLTEEFVAVYRMHPLIADDYSFRSADDDRPLEDRTFREIAGPYSQPVLERVGMRDALYSFGTSYPGAIVLHNFPRFLQEFERPDGQIQDLAATDILRSRELGVPRYNEFRRQLHLEPAASFEELCLDPAWVDGVREVYDGDIEAVDATVGMLAERRPAGFAFSDTAFRIFILMASRRLNSDRFFTTDYTPRVYTRAGLDWIDDNTMRSVLTRHYPRLAGAMASADNAFVPWARGAGT